MAGKFEAYKQDGSLLFDTDRICYGLVKSAYLQLVERWPQKYLRSINLDPNDGSSWSDDPAPHEPLFGISIPNYRSPIVFLVGDGSLAGEIISGTTKTLLYVGASTSTKAFAFDLMSDAGPITGFKCFRESDGALTFNSGQPPLNVIAAIPAPALAPVQPSTQFPGYRYTAYAGGSNHFPAPLISSDYPQIKTYGVVSVGGGELGAYLTFSRQAAVCYGYEDGYPGDGGRFYIYGAQEGVGGGAGVIRFMFCKSPATTRTEYNNRSSFWYDIPTDVNPTALVIRASSYPFPFN